MISAQHVMRALYSLVRCLHITEVPVPVKLQLRNRRVSVEAFDKYGKAGCLLQESHIYGDRQHVAFIKLEELIFKLISNFNRSTRITFDWKGGKPVIVGDGVSVTLEPIADPPEFPTLRILTRAQIKRLTSLFQDILWLYQRIPVNSLVRLQATDIKLQIYVRTADSEIGIFRNGNFFHGEYVSVYDYERFQQLVHALKRGKALAEYLLLTDKGLGFQQQVERIVFDIAAPEVPPVVTSGQPDLSARFDHIHPALFSTDLVEVIFDEENNIAHLISKNGIQLAGVCSVGQQRLFLPASLLGGIWNAGSLLIQRDRDDQQSWLYLRNGMRYMRLKADSISRGNTLTYHGGAGHE